MFLLPTIVAFYVQNFVYVPSLSSPLLLRNYPNTFAFIPIPSMSLSSRNRSISKIFRHILPCIAPVCEGMHYHKTGVPWQTNKILIFLIFPVFSGFSSLFTFLHFSLFLAYFGISLHIFVINFGKNFGKFQVCTKGKSAIGNRQVRNWGLRYILAFSHFSLIFIRSL